MKRIYHHYKLWEDWRDGLYRQAVTAADEVLISRSVRLLSNPDWTRRAMMQVVTDWRYAADVNLSNRGRNRRAWLGQSACCWVCGASEDLTKQAWHRLSLAEQDAANAIADDVIAYWERELCQKLN